MGKGAFSIHRPEERILMLKNPEKKHYQTSFMLFRKVSREKKVLFN